MKSRNEMEWTGFKFPMGFFVVIKDGNVRFGKCNPVTKEVIEWYEFEDKKQG
jgi:hypothetical protein